MAAALQGILSASMRILIAWVPMLPPDSLEAAASAAGSFPDATHFWDGDRRLASELGAALGITSAQSIGAPGRVGFAWDVYLAYGPGKAWGGLPDFWMHQLGVDHAPRLDPDEFRRRIERLFQA